MLCLHSLTWWCCPLEPPLQPERLKNTIWNGWGKFSSIVPILFLFAYLSVWLHVELFIKSAKKSPDRFLPFCFRSKMDIWKVGTLDDADQFFFVSCFFCFAAEWDLLSRSSSPSSSSLMLLICIYWSWNMRKNGWEVERKRIGMAPDWPPKRLKGSRPIVWLG